MKQPKLFTKILVANRGEIAIRIINACHQLGIKAVAVYSDPDASAMHVREAGEAYHIGPAQPIESYLNQTLLIETAKKAGCEAIHPGYGFLAENSRFAQLCIDSGLVFIGPSPEAIRLLGNKVESRKTMAAAGVPLTPGIKADSDLDDKSLIKAAEQIGFPVLVKAAAGGGGKGMRVVDDPANLQAALDGARREAKSAFGDPMVYLEKYLVKPRHIEFQIFGDQYGHRIHMYERECSIQRRHQKIIEESPSAALNNELRSRMGEAAVMVANAAGYYNAGTVEFLLDKDFNYYFLEVNTRIQVEHPVTEEVLGVDLVCEQIRVAMGEELSWEQNELQQRGHAVECRIYAEDAAAGFLPAAGPALFIKEPIGPGIRYDSGVETGDEVSVYYDPIIAKLVAWSETRDMAIQRALIALKKTVILGLTTNKDFLVSVLKHPEFKAANLHTGFLQQYIPDWKPDIRSTDNLNLALAAAQLPGKSNGKTAHNGKVVNPEPWQTVGQWQICSSEYK